MWRADELRLQQCYVTQWFTCDMTYEWVISNINVPWTTARARVMWRITCEFTSYVTCATVFGVSFVFDVTSLAACVERLEYDRAKLRDVCCTPHKSPVIQGSFCKKALEYTVAHVRYSKAALVERLEYDRARLLLWIHKLCDVCNSASCMNEACQM